MAFIYQSGDEILPGDKVLLRGEPGEVEVVRADGVMITEPKFFGRVFFSEPENQEDLTLVERAGSVNRPSA